LHQVENGEVRGGKVETMGSSAKVRAGLRQAFNFPTDPITEPRTPDYRWP